MPPPVSSQKSTTDEPQIMATKSSTLLPFIKRLSLPNWFKIVNRKNVSKDFLAGLTGAVVVLPQGVAFSAIAGLPPQYGLYTAMVPPIVAALFGSSFHLISGPTTAISIVVFSTLAPLVAPGSPEFVAMAITLAFLVGFFQLAMGLARMGGVINFVSHSVVVGFTCGAAILIATSQLKHLFGLELPRGAAFLHTWITLFKSFMDINPYVLTVGLITLLSSIIIRRFWPFLPNMLLGMVAGSLLAAWFGVEEHNIALVGEIPAGLPPISMPDLSFYMIRELSSGALAIALLGLVEAVSIARSVSLQSGQRIKGSREFVGQGLANITGSFFSAYPSSGSFTRTGVNYKAGAQTPLAAVFAAFFLVVIILLVAPYAAYLPMAAMAGVILQVAYNLIDVKHIRKIIKSTTPGTAVMTVTFLSTLFLELEFAIYVGVMLSLSLYLNRTSQPKVVSIVPDPNSPWRRFVTDKSLQECPQLKIVRIDGSLYFGSVGHVETLLRKIREKEPERKNLLIVGSGVNFIDLAGAEMLRHESDQRRKLGGNLFLFDIKDQVCQMFQRSGIIDRIGQDHVFQSKRFAVKTILREYHDKKQCDVCLHKVFLECNKHQEPKVKNRDELEEDWKKILLE
ncbi:MAG: SulP family inorganic anion transporter [Magnetococcales bacterium]|nr:SulP family inorganic anion transporter [Magnetococcales bacterium]